MIDHVCPGCEERLRSSPRLAGLPIRCPHCRGEVQVPRDVPRRPRPARWTPAWAIVLAGAVGLVALGTAYRLVTRVVRATAPQPGYRFASRQPSEPTEFVLGNGDVVCLEIPARWSKTTPPNDERGSLVVSNPEDSAAVVVFARPKRDVRDPEPRRGYAAILARHLAARHRKGEVSDGPHELRISGLPATRYEVHYTSTETGQRKALLLTVVEGAEDLYAILAECSVVDIPQQRGTLEKIVATFREHF
jgi:hypothetical protein